MSFVYCQFSVDSTTEDEESTEKTESEKQAAANSVSKDHKTGSPNIILFENVDY